MKPTRTIPLTGTDAVAVVEAADFAALSRWRWHYANGYARRVTKRRGRAVPFYMHRVIIGAGAGEIVDHINGDPLDNRRDNLRLCTKSQNGANQAPSRGGSSRFKGVCFDRYTNNWKASIGIDGKVVHLGRFDSEQEAARAYDAAAVEAFGEFAWVNFPREAA